MGCVSASELDISNDLNDGIKESSIDKYPNGEACINFEVYEYHYLSIYEYMMQILDPMLSLSINNSFFKSAIPSETGTNIFEYGLIVRP